VHINATPWATIEVDGTNLGETPIAGVPLAPGSHVFKARMPDGRVIERTVQIGAETRYVTLQTPTEPSGAAPSFIAAPEASAPKEPGAPPAAQSEGSQPPSSASAQAESASPAPPAPLVAARPVTPIPVQINATPWATIEVDGTSLGETPIAGVPLAPGSHVFKARMADGRVIERTVQISAETRYVTFD
jgi:hypothetical protein